MKKVFAALLPLLFSLCLAQGDDLGGRTLRIGSDTTYPPMETINSETGEIVGFDVDLMNALCAKLNCRAEFVTTAWDGIFPALNQGDFDMVVSGVSITDERDRIVDFSDPYLTVSQAILVRVDASGLTAEDFEAGDLMLGAQTGTTNAAVADGLVGHDRTRLYDTFGSAVLALQNGDLDGVVIDGTSANAYEQQFAGELTVSITGLDSDPLGLVFDEGDPLVDSFNAALAELKEDGMLEDITAKWFTVND